MQKKVKIKDDGRYVIFYTFPKQSKEGDDV